jgi:hypothetical protein
VDHAAGGEPRGPDPGFLSELASGRGEGGLAAFDLPPRKLPKAAKEPLGRPALDQPAPSMFEHDDRRLDMRPRRTDARPRDRARVRELSVGPAVGLHRALGAAGGGREADRLAQFHQCLVERARLARGREVLERPAEPLPHHRGAEVALFPSPAGGDSKAVRLQRHIGSAEGEARDGPGDVGSDSRQSLELGHGPRQLAAEGGPEDPGGGVQVPGARVVPRALPCLQDRAAVGPGQRGDVREPGDEPLEVGNRLSDARLLEEDLGHPDAVRVAVEPPGEGTTVGPEPGDEGSGHRGGDGRYDLRPAARAHGGAPKEESP